MQAAAQHRTARAKAAATRAAGRVSSSTCRRTVPRSVRRRCPVPVFCSSTSADGGFAPGAADLVHGLCIWCGVLLYQMPLLCVPSRKPGTGACLVLEEGVPITSDVCPLHLLLGSPLQRARIGSQCAPMLNVVHTQAASAAAPTLDILALLQPLLLLPSFAVLTADRTTADVVMHEQDAGAAVASTSSSIPAAGPAPVYKTVKQLRLRSAAAYLPHPDKESYGGEDAHFVSNVSGGAIGVADGEWLSLACVAECAAVRRPLCQQCQRARVGVGGRHTQVCRKQTETEQASPLSAT